MFVLCDEYCERFGRCLQQLNTHRASMNESKHIRRDDPQQQQQQLMDAADGHSMTISSGISPEDQQKIVELRKLVKDDLTEYYDTDFNLLRWLQGHHQLSVPDIARKLRYHLKAR
ncbi:unnamed protein product [Heligmosomoides polygyrus]|uniref:Sigma-70 family RNA polymerase sigma factor n=1 Tax=Heligmosomoides polygyrus TaxID=6339 RepID=A0A3P8FFT9_HELPZ|nr:unnamed protein product [Heligmosomoides polygyrus]